MKASNYKTVRSKSRKRSVDKVYTGKIIIINRFRESY